MPSGIYPRNEEWKERNKEFLERQSKRWQGENNPNWKENPSNRALYEAKHRAIRQLKSKPQFCEICGMNPPTHLVFKDYSAGENTPEKYTLNPDDYKYGCMSCHFKQTPQFQIRTKEDKEKISKSMKGRIPWNKNKTLPKASIKTRKLMSESQKQRWRIRKENME